MVVSKTSNVLMGFFVTLLPLWSSSLLLTGCRFKSYIWCIEFITKKGVLQHVLQ